MPITASAAFSASGPEELENIFAGRAAGHVYGRLTNPTVTALERRWAALDEARGCAAYSTGMAAVSAVFTALVECGEEVVSTSSLFGGTRSFFDNVLRRAGVTVRFVDPDDIDGLRAAVNGKTRLLFLEALGNPRMDVPDIEVWGQTARDNGIPLVLDTTLVTPALMKAGNLGAAVTVQSGTKFLTGNGSVLSGAVTDTGIYKWKEFPGEAIRTMVNKAGSDMAFLVYLRKVARQNNGGALSPFDAYLALLGADTLDLRMSRHSENALALASYLEGRDDVPGVSQVGLASSPWHARAAKYFAGRWGGLLTFRAGSRERAFSVLNNLKLARVQTNLGDSRTLALHLESTIHREQNPEAQAAAGVTDDLIRVSAGLESPRDIINDFGTALDRSR
jgi:O-acetylhomoserine (thiol)-lyase